MAIITSTYEYRGKQYKTIEISNEIVCLTFANTDLYDAMFTDYCDGEDNGGELNDDARSVWNDIYYHTDLVDQYDGAEFVWKLYEEEPEFFGILRGTDEVYKQKTRQTV